jgi:predicted double-glycine peptidase
MSGGKVKSDYHRDGYDFHTMTTNEYKNGGKVENYDRTGGDDYATYRGGSPDFGCRNFVADSNHPTGRYYIDGKEVPRWYYFGGPVVINKKEKETYGQSTQRPIIANGGEFIDLPQDNSDNAYIMEFPELRQVFNFDCGASALQACLAYYGFDMREDKIMKMLDSRPTDEFNNGSKISAIIKVAEEFKLKANKVDGMKPEDLIDYIKQDIPVIILLQAWRDSQSPSNWETDFSDGHYVVAVGYNKSDILFEDPSSYMRSYLSYDELATRWHSRGDDNKTKIYGTGIVVKGKPKFKEGAVSHMD